MNFLVFISEHVELSLCLGLPTENRRLGEDRKSVVSLGRSDADRSPQPFY
jgi:hypothetical protein